MMRVVIVMAAVVVGGLILLGVWSGLASLGFNDTDGKFAVIVENDSSRTVGVGYCHYDETCGGGELAHEGVAPGDEVALIVTAGRFEKAVIEDADGEVLGCLIFRFEYMYEDDTIRYLVSRASDCYRDRATRPDTEGTVLV